MLYFLPVILYVSYIGVGLPNGILSAAWPTMHESLGASVGPYIVAYALETGGGSPIYPCIIHMTPALFGEEKAQTLIGIELAGAYVGSLSMPPLFGLLANAGKTSLLPAYILALTLGMIVLHELLHRRYAARCED